MGLLGKLENSCECGKREEADGAGVLSILLCYPELSFGAMTPQAGHLDVEVIKEEERDTSPCHQNATFYSTFSPRRQGIAVGSTCCTAKLFAP